MCPPSPRQLARWLLLGLVIGGVLAMHILSDHDSGGAGEPAVMAMGTAPLAATPAMAMIDRPAAEAPAAALGGLAAGHGSALSAMDCCLLFLTAGGALLALRRTGGSTTAQETPAGGFSRGCTPRGPPGGGPPRIRLCVLRV